MSNERIGFMRQSTRNIFTIKDFVKIIKAAIQWVCIISIVVFGIRHFFFRDTYVDIPIAETAPGFIAVSYSGVSMDGAESTISGDILNQELSLLKESGFVTVTQRDIVEYFNGEKDLPERALFLMFSDGRRDTVVMADPVIRRLNYKATVNTFGEQIVNDKLMTLSAKDLINLERSSFWEIGSNGYRLAYINVYGRPADSGAAPAFLGQMDSIGFRRNRDNISRYNHYLMDFIRNEENSILESPQEMERRITRDYELLRKTYTEYLGKVPELYAIMHANTNQYGSNELVSEINYHEIEKTFSMNFNRIGGCYNDRNSSVYDLTYLRPESYWHANHLLMRIHEDTQEDVKYTTGDPNKAADWDLSGGAAEFRDGDIVLTSPAGQYGLMKFKKPLPGDFELSLTLNGSMRGEQSLFIKAADEDGGALSSYIQVKLLDNVISVIEGNREQDENSGENTLHENILISRALFTPYNYDQDEIPLSAPNTFPLRINARGNKLTVVSEELILLNEAEINADGNGFYMQCGVDGLALGLTEEEIFSQPDTVYDGVFSDIVITDLNGSADVFYQNKLYGVNEVRFVSKNAWRSVLTWFINVL